MAKKEEEKGKKETQEVVGLDDDEEQAEQPAEQPGLINRYKKIIIPAAIALVSFTIAISAVMFLGNTHKKVVEEAAVEDTSGADTKSHDADAEKLMGKKKLSTEGTVSEGGIDTAAIMKELAFLDYVPEMEEKENKKKQKEDGSFNKGSDKTEEAYEGMTPQDSVDTLNWLAREMAKLAEVKAADLKRKKELKALEYKIDQAMIKIEQAESAHIIELARLYDAMRPEEVGKLFENLSDQAVMAILPRMKPGNAAKILAIMPPKRAASISTQMITVLEK